MRQKRYRTSARLWIVWNRDGEAKDDAKNEAWEAFKSNEELLGVGQLTGKRSS